MSAARKNSAKTPCMVTVRIFEVRRMQIRKDWEQLRIPAKLKHTIRVPLQDETRMEAADAWMKCVGISYRARYELGVDETCAHTCCGLSVETVARHLKALDNEDIYQPGTFRFEYQDREWLIMVDTWEVLLGRLGFWK